MIKNYLKLVLVLLTFNIGCSTTKMNNAVMQELPAAALKPFGRFVINDNQKLELISSAVHFGISFEGETCQIYASLLNKNGHNYLQYELDGVYQKRIRIEGSSSEPIIIKAPKGGKHTLWLYKATEAHTGAINIEKVSGKNVKPLERPTAPVIEFIGNSITCGAAADPSEIACGTGEYHDQHNAYMAYGPRVARELGVNFILSSVSGIGIYRNWNSNGPTMPQVYEKADFQDYNKQLWNFKTYSPNVVSIALGTNDFSRGDGVKQRLPFDSSAFISAYIKFVQLVKSKYPTAQIALLSSPMVGGGDRSVLQNCLTSVKKEIDALYTKDKKIELFFFDPMQPHGCSGHPDVNDHAILAQQLVPFFKKLI